MLKALLKLGRQTSGSNVHPVSIEDDEPQNAQKGHSLKTLMPVLFAGLALILTAYLLVISILAFGAISDFPEYYAAARLILSGHGADVYNLNALAQAQHSLFPALGNRDVIVLYVPPMALPWLVPVGWLPAEIARYAWKALLVVALGGSIYVLAKTFSLSTKGVCWTIAIIFVSGAAYDALRIDQLAALLLLAFTLAIYFLKRNKPMFAALALSFLLLKPQQLLPFLVYSLGAKQYRLLLMLTSFTAILFAISMLEIGPQGLANYRELLASSIQNSTHMQPELNATLRGQLLRFFPDAKTSIMNLSSIVYALVLGISYLAGRKFADKGRWLDAGLLTAVPLGLVLSVHCHDYDLLLLAPSLVVLLRDDLQDKIPPWALLVGMLAGMMFELPFYIYIHYDYLLKNGLINPYFWALLALAIGLLVFVAKNEDEFKHDIS